MENVDKRYPVETYEPYIGRTLTGLKYLRRGDGTVLRLEFGDAYFENLMAFTPAEHQLAIAKEALELVNRNGCGGCSIIASDALHEMERFSE